MKLIECKEAIYGSYTFLDIFATRKEIEEKVGSFEKKYTENDTDGKCYFEWFVQTDDGSLKFRIYDWKEERVVPSDERIYWHVGAPINSKNEQTILQKCLEDYGFTVMLKNI